jgi:hypothetical protein
METRTASSCLGIGASMLALACASAFAAFPQPSRNSALVYPKFSGHGESTAPDRKVVVADPRHPGIRIELPASELQSAGEDMQGVYRKLVRTAASASATIAVAENGRVFFRRAGITTRVARPLGDHDRTVVVDIGARRAGDD